MSTLLKFTDLDLDTNYLEIRQRFTLPDDFALGENAITFAPRDPAVTQVLPNIIGYGFLARIDQLAPNSGDTDPDALAAVEFDWAFVDRSAGDENVIRTGTFSGAVNLGVCWIDVFFDPNNPIETTKESKYEFRVGKNKIEPTPFNVVYTQSPAPLTGSATPIIDNDIWIKDSVGDVSEYTNYAMIYRVWSDSGESGQDVLGNRYREGVRRDKASRATDDSYLTSWVSQPNPDPTGVEALYFDVRTRDIDTNALIPSIIDSIKVNPLFAGVYMHVYWSNEGVTVGGTPAKAPISVDEWDTVLWTHVQQSYVLDKNMAYDLPLPIRASWLKLEFSNLQPIPFKITDFPALPAVPYRQFPDIVSRNFVGINRKRNSALRTTEDHFIQNNVRVKKSIFDTFRPDLGDLTYDKRYNIEENDVDINNTVFGPQATVQGLDPITLGRIYYSSSATNWGPNVLTQMDAFSSVLGLRTQQVKAGTMAAHPFEVINPRSRPITQQVSQSNDRTEDVISVPDIYFLQTSRHVYKQMKAPFNGKAYGVGVRDVQFLRNDFTSLRDDAIIHDALADATGSPLVSINTWVSTPATTIPIGTNVYVTYEVELGDGTTIEQIDEVVQFENEASTAMSFTSVPLQVGGGRATNVKVWTGLLFTGQFYSPGVDYTILYDPTTFQNAIARNELHFRITAT